MNENSTNGPGNSNPVQQQFLPLSLRSEREIFRCVAALVPKLSEVDDIVQQTAITLREKLGAFDSNQPFTPWAFRFALKQNPAMDGSLWQLGPLGRRPRWGDGARGALCRWSASGVSRTTRRGAFPDRCCRARLLEREGLFRQRSLLPLQLQWRDG